MSDANRTLLSYVEESVFGTTPVSALKNFRFTGESLDHTTESSQSAEVRADRQIPDHIRTNVGASGDLNFELSYSALDDFLEGLLGADWPATVSISRTDIQAIAPNNVFSTVAGDFSGIQIGQWVLVAGFDTGANNGYFLVTDKQSDSSGDWIQVTGGTLVDEAAGDTVTIKGTCIFNGTTAKSYSIEKHFQDVSKFDSFVGCRVGAMSLNIAANAIITGSLSLTGLRGAATQVATIGTGANVAAPTNDVMNAIDPVAAIREGGTLVTQDITAITLAITNNLRAQPAVATLGAAGIGIGSFNVSGTFNAYFEDRSFLDKYRGFTETSLAFRVIDGDGNAYMFNLPAIKFSGGPVVIPGQDQDVMVDLSFVAKMDTVASKMLSITRFPA